MVNEYKVRAMTQAALYESSQQYRRDFFVKRYFKADYIALNRFITKAWMTVFYAIALLAYMFQQVYVESVDLLHYDYQGFVVKNVLLYLAISIGISLITWGVYGSRYAKAEKRMAGYFKKLDQIDRYAS